MFSSRSRSPLTAISEALEKQLARRTLVAHGGFIVVSRRCRMLLTSSRRPALHATTICRAFGWIIGQIRLGRPPHRRSLHLWIYHLPRRRRPQCDARVCRTPASTARTTPHDLYFLMSVGSSILQTAMRIPKERLESLRGQVASSTTSFIECGGAAQGFRARGQGWMHEWSLLRAIVSGQLPFPMSS